MYIVCSEFFFKILTHVMQVKVEFKTFHILKSFTHEYLPPLERIRVDILFAVNNNNNNNNAEK